MWVLALALGLFKKIGLRDILGAGLLPVIFLGILFNYRYVTKLQASLEKVKSDYAQEHALRETADASLKSLNDNLELQVRLTNELQARFDASNSAWDAQSAMIFDLQNTWSQTDDKADMARSKLVILSLNEHNAALNRMLEQPAKTRH